ncbi:MAG: hypothetical protein J2P31_02300 [Blastocatellia bacterium]|nr:hypothetical protein [Blastocatellia bacterium]
MQSTNSVPGQTRGHKSQTISSISKLKEYHKMDIMLLIAQYLAALLAADEARLAEAAAALAAANK